MDLSVLFGGNLEGVPNSFYFTKYRYINLYY
jgi:hypothetical protein